jgi:hypothetical protein
MVEHVGEAYRTPTAALPRSGLNSTSHAFVELRLDAEAWHIGRTQSSHSQTLVRLKADAGSVCAESWDDSPLQHS